ncbi:hypothetical protein Y032_0302g1851 [Ancylostoma ceylanicum]|uniref:Uncharacterized protein n=1 Tax=Ancylostoma ceylanicum TaxID=53326 RepID=A0A016S4P9_9BILA|nr:hypothetical protein Y032_0302g1851 [Ancylostoma ceylanicum]
MAQVTRATRLHPTRVVIMIMAVAFCFLFLVTSVYNIAAVPAPTSQDPETGYTRQTAPLMHISEKNAR